jgi:glycosyltransferase involved in cell wall biosynthesis
MRIAAIGVVVPAHNEQLLLPACLDALEIAVDAVAPILVTVVVVLDSCTDASAEVAAARPWVRSLCIDGGNVGAARRAGTDEALRLAAGLDPDRVWLATTDADSVVPPDWLSGQLALAADGWEAVIGTVAVDDWSEHHPSVATRWRAGYHPIEHHAHVHGANLGLTASAYLAAGGWPSLPAHEDVVLLKRLAGRRVVSTATLPVVTSARRQPRAVGGFGDTLRDLAG